MTEQEQLELDARKAFMSLVGKAHLVRALFVEAKIPEPPALARFFAESVQKDILDNLARVEQLEGHYDV